MTIGIISVDLTRMGATSILSDSEVYDHVFTLWNGAMSADAVWINTRPRAYKVSYV
jgi:hypothetical protein